MFFQLFAYFVCKLFAIGDKNCSCHFIVLCLRKQICRNMSRIVCSVCNNKNFAGTRNHININSAENLLFSLCNKGITGTHNFINLGYTFCSVSKGSNRLRTTDFEDSVHPCNACRRKNNGLDFTFFCRSYHNNFRATCNFCRNAVHKN